MLLKLKTSFADISAAPSVLKEGDSSEAGGGVRNLDELNLKLLLTFND